MYNEKQIMILEKAEGLFAKKGCDATTIRDIAKEGLVSPAMISYYFSSKEKLIESLFELRMESSKLNVEYILKNTDISPALKIDIIISAYIDRVFNSPEFYKIMLAEQMMNNNNTILTSIKELKLNYAQLLDNVIKEGAAQKVFKVDKKVDVILLMNAMTGFVLQTIINKSFYIDYYKLNALPQEEVNENLKIKINAMVKNIFKNHLQNAN